MKTRFGWADIWTALLGGSMESGRFAVVAPIVSFLAVGGAHATTYDLAEDFSLAGNPNGPYAYGSTTTLGGVVFHPSFGDLHSVIRFTVPATGLYEIDAAYEGIGNAGTTSRVFILKNSDGGSPLLAGDVNGFCAGGPSYLSPTLTLTTGDTIDFVVSMRNGDARPAIRPISTPGSLTFPNRESSVCSLRDSSSWACGFAPARGWIMGQLPDNTGNRRDGGSFQSA